MKHTLVISMPALSLQVALAMPVRLAAPPRRYTVTDLGTVGNPPGQPYFIANNGLASGAAAVPAGRMQAVLGLGRLNVDIGTPGLRGGHERRHAVGQAESAVPTDGNRYTKNGHR